MKITEKLFNQLLDDLSCVAISANGGVPLDSSNEPIITDEQLHVVEMYATHTVLKILREWEETMNEEWEVVADEEN